MKLAALDFKLNPNQLTDYFPESLAKEDTASGFNLLMSNIITTFITISGILLLFYFIISAIRWITASGDSDKLKEARDSMLNAIIGFVIVVIAYFFVGLIGGILGIDGILTPSFPFLRPPA